MNAPIVLGHAGHYAIDALFSAPVFVLAIWFVIVSMRDRRRRRREGRL